MNGRREDVKLIRVHPAGGLVAHVDDAELIAVQVPELGAIELDHPLAGRPLADAAGGQGGGMDLIHRRP